MLLRVGLEIDSRHMHTPLADAQGLLVAQARRLGREDVALAALSGRVLAEPLCAPRDLPPWDNSALDGYALRAGELPGPLPIVGDVLAGMDPGPLAPGTAVRIATGGLIPDGADAVLAIEDATELDGRVTTASAVEVGHGVRRAGTDISRGGEALPAGVRVGSLQLSVIATLGLAAASCARQPRAVCFTTGDELVSAGATLRRGQVYDSNTILTAAALEQFGCRVRIGGPIPDNEAQTKALLAAAFDADLVVTSGGVSVGPRDHVKPALRALGVQELFWRVALQPGRPAFAAKSPSGAIVLGLPGNPLSALVGLHLLARPVVDAMLGAERQPPVRVTLAEAVNRHATRLRALPARIVDGVASPLAGASFQLARAGRADHLVMIDPGSGVAEAGTETVAVPLAVAV